MSSFNTQKFYEVDEKTQQAKQPLFTAQMLGMEFATNSDEHTAPLQMLPILSFVETPAGYIEVITGLKAGNRVFLYFAVKPLLKNEKEEECNIAELNHPAMEMANL